MGTCIEARSGEHGALIFYFFLLTWIRRVCMGAFDGFGLLPWLWLFKIERVSLLTYVRTMMTD